MIAAISLLIVGKHPRCSVRCSPTSKDVDRDMCLGYCPQSGNCQDFLDSGSHGKVLFTTGSCKCTDLKAGESTSDSDCRSASSLKVVPFSAVKLLRVGISNGFTKTHKSSPWKPEDSLASAREEENIQFVKFDCRKKTCNVCPNARAKCCNDFVFSTGKCAFRSLA